MASNMGKALSELRQRKNVRWTYISPAGDFQAEGERTGSYLLGGEELTLNSRGESIISYADYAIAMVDEAVKGHHDQQRISAEIYPANKERILENLKAKRHDFALHWSRL